MKRKIIKTLLRYRRLISDHKGEHETLQSLTYYDKDSILAKTIEKDQKELKDIDRLILDINDDRSWLSKIKAFVINILRKPLKWWIN